MVNILCNRYTIDHDWCFPKFKEYLKPNHKVVVIAFSFRDSKVKSLSDWKTLYGKESGIYYMGIVESLKSYGISENNINFLNYFIDSVNTAKRKIKQADILYFLGGLPEKMYERLLEFDLTEELKQHDAVIVNKNEIEMIGEVEYFPII